MKVRHAQAFFGGMDRQELDVCSWCFSLQRNIKKALRIYFTFVVKQKCLCCCVLC